MTGRYRARRAVVDDEVSTKGRARHSFKSSATTPRRVPAGVALATRSARGARLVSAGHGAREGRDPGSRMGRGIIIMPGRPHQWWEASKESLGRWCSGPTWSRMRWLPICFHRWSLSLPVSSPSAVDASKKKKARPRRRSDLHGDRTARKRKGVTEQWWVDDDAAQLSNWMRGFSPFKARIATGN